MQEENLDLAQSLEAVIAGVGLVSARGPLAVFTKPTDGVTRSCASLKAGARPTPTIRLTLDWMIQQFQRASEQTRNILAYGAARGKSALIPVV